MNSKPRTVESQDKDLDQSLAKLRAEYARKLPGKINTIVELWRKLTEFSWNDDAFNVMYRLLHGLSGSGKVFGYESLSQQSRNIEQYLLTLMKQKQSPSEKERSTIDRLISGLPHHILTSKKVDDTTDSSSSDNRLGYDEKHRKVVFIVDDDQELCLYIGMKLQFEGYQTRTFTDVAQALAYMENVPPDLVVLDVVFSNNPIAGFEVVQSFRELSVKKLPIVFISARTDLEARARAVRVGGNAYLTKPFDFSELVSKIDELLDIYQTSHGKVLIVDDEENLCSYYANILTRNNLNVKTVSRPIELMRVLNEFLPDIVIMDVHMPGYTGLELAAVMRQDNRFVGTPIIFLTADNKTEIQEQAYGLGANEFAVKPITGENLLHVVQRQLSAARRVNSLIKTVSKKDRFGNASNNSYFMEQLEVAIATANNSEPYQYLFDIKLKNPAIINERLDLDEIETFNQILSEQLTNLAGRDFLISQFSDTVYMMLSGFIDEGTMLSACKGIADGFGKISIPIRDKNIKVALDIGVVEINQHALSVKQILAEAESASLECHQAKDRRYVVARLKDIEQEQIAEIYDNVKDALEKGRMNLVYQPIVCTQNRKFEMYEVLLRCQMENGATVYPAQFLPLFQAKNEMWRIDKWVIQKAIHSLSSDSHARSAADIMVKISGSSLKEKQLIAMISNSLIDGGITGTKRIMFLVSELDVIDNIDYAVNFHDQVVKLGCAVAIDHFGASESSEELFELLKPDYVKLHPRLTQKMMEDKEIKAKVAHLADMANKAKSEVIACNIENPMMLSHLWAMGIRCFQGYFIKEPNAGLDFDFKGLNLIE